MSITEINEKINSAYNDVDEMTQIPDDIRFEIIHTLEDLMEKLDQCIEDYGDDPAENDSFDDDDDFSDDGDGNRY